MNASALCARERDHPDRPRAEQERRDQLAAQAEVDELAVLRVRRVGEVAGGRRPRRRARARAPSRGAGRRCPAGRHVVRAAPGGRDRPRRVVLDEHDRRAVERHEPAHLADERAERLLDLERRPERARQRFAASSTSTRRPSASRRRSASAARSRAAPRLDVEPADEPADDQPRQEQQAGREGDAVPDEARPGGAKSCTRHHSMNQKTGNEQRPAASDAAGEAVAKRRLDDDEDERAARLVAVLVREDRSRRRRRRPCRRRAPRSRAARSQRRGVDAREPEEQRPRRRRRRRSAPTRRRDSPAGSAA